MKLEKEVYIVFYGLMFIFATLLFGFAIYNIHIKERKKFVDPNINDSFKINVKDSRYFNDGSRSSSRTFTNQRFIISTSNDVYKKDDKNFLSDFAKIYPPYKLKKVENSDTIWIFRQFYGDTLFMKLDTIDENLKYEMLFKKLVKNKFS